MWCENEYNSNHILTTVQYARIFKLCEPRWSQTHFKTIAHRDQRHHPYLCRSGISHRAHQPRSGHRDSCFRKRCCGGLGHDQNACWTAVSFAASSSRKAFCGSNSEARIAHAGVAQGWAGPSLGPTSGRPGLVGSAWATAWASRSFRPLWPDPLPRVCRSSYCLSSTSSRGGSWGWCWVKRSSLSLVLSC